MRWLCWILGTLLFLPEIGVANPIDPISYEARLPSQTQKVDDEHLYFSLSPTKWLIVGKSTLYSWVWEGGPSLQPQPTLAFKVPFLHEPTGRLLYSRPQDVRGFSQKDGSVVLVWWQVGSYGRKEKKWDHKYFVARYKKGKWSQVQSIPGQTKALHDEKVVVDDSGRILVFWQQPNETFDKSEKLVREKNIPAFDSSLAWYYSVITDKEIRPAALIPGQQNTVWYHLSVLPDTQHQRIIFALSGGNASTKVNDPSRVNQQIVVGFWKNGQFSSFLPLTQEGYNSEPLLLALQTGRFIAIWNYNKEGFDKTKGFIQNQRSFSTRYTVLEPGASAWEPIRTLPGEILTSSENHFVATPEGGLFRSDVAGSIEPFNVLRTTYISPKGVLMTQEIQTLGGNDIFLSPCYAVDNDGKATIALSERTGQDSKVKLYTTTWNKGNLAPLQPLPGQGRAMEIEDLQLRMGAHNQPLLAWVKASGPFAGYVNDITQEIYASYGGIKGFAPAVRLPFASARKISDLGWVVKPGTTTRLWWQENFQRQENLWQNENSFEMATWKNKQWSQEVRAKGFVLQKTYVNAAGQQLFYLYGGNKLGTIFCDKEKCDSMRIWSKPHPNVKIWSQALEAPGDGTLVLSWLEWEQGVPDATRSEAKPKPLPTALHMVRFPNFKASDVVELPVPPHGDSIS